MALVHPHPEATTAPPRGVLALYSDPPPRGGHTPHTADDGVRVHLVGAVMLVRAAPFAALLRPHRRDGVDGWATS